MRWSGETRGMKEQRERKGIRCFALFPRQMKNGRWVWLEPYYSVLLRAIWENVEYYYRFETWLELQQFVHEHEEYAKDPVKYARRKAQAKTEL